jgi:ribonucleoside-diphosphate reductase alpha chain
LGFTNDFSKEVWETTYRYKGETLEGTWRRVAVAISSVEKPELRKEWEEKFYDMLTDFKVLPGGRILANAGTEYKATLINCFVSPEPISQPDSLIGILEVLKHQSLTLKSEGGWGHNFSALRPRGGYISTLGVESPGPVKFMELFDKSSEIITSGSGIEKKNKGKGKIRKGAQMAVIDVWHPSVVEFITAKQNQGKLCKFNMSVNCTDDFMSLVKQVQVMRESGCDQEEIDSVVWELRFPETECEYYEEEWNGDLRRWISKGYPVAVYDTVSVDWLWNLITSATYNRNEPGILFLDRANYFNPLSGYWKGNRPGETIRSTNPCGEQVLAPAGACCLGTLNLTQFISKSGKDFDLKKISKYAGYLARFLDNVNTYSAAPLSEYKHSMENKRRIGCGVMGWGSSLYMVKTRFGSKEAEVLREEVMKSFTTAVIKSSIEIAREKGKFSYCDPFLHQMSPYWTSIGLSKEVLKDLREYGIRNSSLFSIQPNGNSSVLSNLITGGCEPCFSPEYIRTSIIQTPPDELKGLIPDFSEGEFHETDIFKFVKEGDESLLRGEVNGTLYKIDKNRGLLKETLCEDYGVWYLKQKGEWNPEAEWAVTAQSLTVEEHVEDLKGFAKYCDSSVSKTVNIPNNYPFEKFQRIYLDAYDTGCIKGITTYRAGTMANVLSVIEEDEIILQDVKLPDSSEAVVKVLRAENRKWYLTVVTQDKKPFALFVRTNHAEKNVTTSDALDKLFALAVHKGIPEEYIKSTREKCSPDSNSDKIARAISLLLRHGVKVVNIVSELDKVDEVFVGSFLFQIKKFLSSYIKDGEKVKGICSNCKSTKLIYSEGCSKCQDCGSSKCG